jgi:hypothetical protein
LGDFSHLGNTEDIPVLMGALAHEISTASLCGVSIEGFSGETTEIKIGQSHVGVLSTGREFIFGFVPSSKVGVESSSLVIQETCITEQGLQNVLNGVIQCLSSNSNGLGIGRVGSDYCCC